jgi:hypothetical protein
VDDMSGTIRTALGVLIGMLAAVKGEAAPPAAQEPSLALPSQAQPSTMAAFIAQLRRDEGLRARFAQVPHAVMREHGIDPVPFNLHRLDAAGRQRLLIDLAQQADPTKPKDGKPSTDADKPPPRNPPPPAPVYGPPPKPR